MKGKDKRGVACKKRETVFNELKVNAVFSAKEKVVPQRRGKTSAVLSAKGEKQSLSKLKRQARFFAEEKEVP